MKTIPWRLALALVIWIVSWRVHHSDPDSSLTLWLELLFLGVVVFTDLGNWVKFPLKTPAFLVRKEVSFDGVRLEFRWRRRARVSIPAASIRSYRFHAVWDLDLIMQDGRLKRMELPSLSSKTAVTTAMSEAGIPHLDAAEPVA